jgi:hypothetical protein
MRLMIVTATRREAATIGHGAIACGSGAAAGETLRSLLGGGGVDAVVIAGICGGLDPSLTPGDVILGRRLVAGERPDLLPHRLLFASARARLRAAALPFVSSQLLTLDRPARSREEKTNLWNQYGAGGVDMETYYLAQAVEAAGGRWLALRSVLDAAASGLPAALHNWRGETDESGLLSRSLRRPQDWPAFAGLAADWRRAARGLKKALDVIVPALAAAQLPAEEPESPREPDVSLPLIEVSEGSPARARPALSS